MILVDTSVWVEFIRHPHSTETQEVQRLLRENQVATTGLIIAEVLQGARSRQEFEDLRADLGDLPYLEVSRQVWVRAGDLAFQLRQRGTGIPLADCLIATLAMEGDHQLYTHDDHSQRVPGLRLHAAGAVR